MTGHAKNPEEKSSEVPEKATRRRFTQEYKERILAEADSCVQPGELGALLRREGLYSSNLTRWRRQQAEGDLAAKRGRKTKPNKKDAQELARLERENQRLAEQLRQAELIIEVQKKVSEIIANKKAEKSD